MFSLIDWLIGFVLVVCFFVAVGRLGKISGYLRKLAQYEKIRMVEAGLIDPQTKKFSKWTFDEDDSLVPVVAMEAAPDNWTCRNGHTNESKFMVCQTCGASK
jgi:hypothetical protein